MVELLCNLLQGPEEVWILLSEMAIGSGAQAGVRGDGKEFVDHLVFVAVGAVPMKLGIWPPLCRSGDLEDPGDLGCLDEVGFHVLEKLLGIVGQTKALSPPHAAHRHSLGMGSHGNHGNSGAFRTLELDERTRENAKGLVAPDVRVVSDMAPEVAGTDVENLERAKDGLQNSKKKIERERI